MMFDEGIATLSRREVLQGAGLLMGTTAMTGLAPRLATAAGYPERTIKIIVPFAPAGPTSWPASSADISAKPSAAP
jgi:hypothetical protein